MSFPRIGDTGRDMGLKMNLFETCSILGVSGTSKWKGLGSRYVALGCSTGR